MPNVKLGPFLKFMVYYKLSQILTLIGGGTPKTTNPSYWGGNIPWLSVVDFNNDNRYVHTTEKTITEEGVQNSSTKILPQGALILSARGTVGALAQLAKPMAFNQSCYGIIAKEQTTNDFLYYLLKDVVEDLQAKGHGSVFNTITRDTFDTIMVNLPSLDEQKRIAEILGSLDDKIELLQKQNKTLEDMAKALFKSWFVDFDVVRAKAALVTRRNLSPLRGKCHNVAKGGPNKPNSSCALVSTHQIYAKSVKNLVRAMRQNLTPQEVKLWQYLRKEQLGVKFRRQFPIDSKYIADFACLEKKLIIELDGTQHAENQHDKERTLYLEDNGFTVLRFWNNEIDKNLIGCLERIRELLNRPPLPAYEENGADNIPLPAYGVLSPQGGQITGKADIMREYHLTEELYDLFPSSFADSPLGPIPSGWEVKKVQEIADIAIGRTPPRKETKWFSTDSTDTTWISIKDLGNCGVFIGDSSEYLTEDAVSKFKIPMIPTKTVVLSFKLTVGRVAITMKEMCSNEAIAQFKDAMVPVEYLYLLLKHINFSLLGSTSSIATAINSNTIKNMNVLIADSVLLSAFKERTQNLFDKIEINLKQIQTLTELRDTLLPRLISGKIRV